MSPDDPTILPAIREKHKRRALSVQYVHSKRTSNIFNPSECIEDHKDEVATCAIDPTGELILSGGLDCLVRICPVYTDDGYVNTMRGHSDLIMEVGFSSDGANFYTCSTDLTVANWDTGHCIRINTFEGHQDSVNTVQSTERSPILCSGSCDGTIRIWDLRAKKCTKTMDIGYRVYATSFTDNENQVISAGDNNDIHIWDMRNNQIVGNLSGHTAGVTGLDVSPCGQFLLSHSYDSTLCTWDISQTQQDAKALNVFPSNQGPDPKYLLRCSWSKYGRLIAGGNDNGEEVNIWDVDTCRVVYTAQGHTDCVNDVKFHPYEPIVLTASNDKSLIIQEIED